MIDLKKIKDLVKLMVANDLTELDLEGEGERITLKRGIGEQSVQLVTPHPAAISPAVSGGAGHLAAVEGNGGVPPVKAVEESANTINSPMVGSFYSASSPDAKPFVGVGDHVDADQVVCIIEAMKVFNEIKADTPGTIEKILAENGQAVEFEQPLFVVKPD